MNIDEKLKEIATGEAFAEFSYVFENWYDADRAIEHLQLPAIISVLPFSGGIERRNGRVSDQQNFAIAFVDKVQRNALGEDNAAVYNRMKQRGVDFLNAIDASGYFEALPQYVPYHVICERLSSIVTGIMFDLTLKEQKHC